VSMILVAAAFLFVRQRGSFVVMLNCLVPSRISPKVSDPIVSVFRVISFQDYLYPQVTVRFDADAIGQVVHNVVVVEEDEPSDLILVFVGPPHQVSESGRAVQTGEYSLPLLLLVRPVQPQISCKKLRATLPISLDLITVGSDFVPSFTISVKHNYEPVENYMSNGKVI